jgi:hypothetical protein
MKNSESIGWLYNWTVVYFIAWLRSRDETKIKNQLKQNKYWSFHLKFESAYNVDYRDKTWHACCCCQLGSQKKNISSTAKFLEFQQSTFLHDIF